MCGMMNKAIFLDRDGTINVEKSYLYRIEDFEFCPGVIEGLRLLQDAGFLLIITTNQSGIARGYYTENDFAVLNDWMLSCLRRYGIIISKVYYCPHLPDATVPEYRVECNCRKPKPGMIAKAIEEFSIDVGESFAIGDKLRDCLSSSAYHINSYLINNNESPEIISSVMNGVFDGVTYMPSFIEAARSIAKLSSIQV